GRAGGAAPGGVSPQRGCRDGGGPMRQRLLGSRAARWSIGLLAIAWSGCRSSPAPQADPPGPQATAAPHSVSVSPDMLKALTGVAVEEHDRPQTLSVAGKVQFDEDRVARILTPLSGSVVDLRVKVGDAVRSGEVLCDVDSREADAAVSDYVESQQDLDL